MKTFREYIVEGYKNDPKKLKAMKRSGTRGSGLSDDELSDKLRMKSYKGNINLSNTGLDKLEGQPELVRGDFICSHNNLTSLKGAPKTVKGDFNCENNKLKSLEGASKDVKGDFNCAGNILTSLKGAPASVGGTFYCYKNQLTSLEGIPKTVGGNFDCTYNYLSSLKGIEGLKCKTLILPKSVLKENGGFIEDKNDVEVNYKVRAKAITFE